MISVNDLIRWARDNATQGGYIKPRDLNEIAEAVDLCSPAVYHYEVNADYDNALVEQSYVIEVKGELPTHCCDCPAHNGESGYCQADRAHRTSDWRPFWCPARER